MLQNLYQLSSSLKDHFVNVRQINKDQSLKEINYDTTLHLGNYEGFLFPLVFKQVSGHVWPDLLRTHWAATYLISQSFTDFLKRKDIKGWTTYPVEVQDLNGNPVSGYRGFSVVGRYSEKRSSSWLKRNQPSFTTDDALSFFTVGDSIRCLFKQNTYDILKKEDFKGVRLGEYSTG